MLRTEPVFDEWFFDVLKPRLDLLCRCSHYRDPRNPDKIIIELDDTREIREALAECEDVQWVML
jgi:hypothetical protein